MKAERLDGTFSSLTAVNIISPVSGAASVSIMLSSSQSSATSMPLPRCVRFLKFGSDGGEIEEMVACVSEAPTVIKAERQVKTCVGEDEDWGRKKKEPARGSVPCVECVILPHIYTPCSSQKKIFSCLVQNHFPYVDLVEIKGVMSGLISQCEHTLKLSRCWYTSQLFGSY